MSFDCDIIVVGSGVGGMTWASAASKKGYKVLVFEAGVSPGGYCQSFNRKGHRFNTSVHKVGGEVAKSGIDSFMRLLGEPPLEWYHFEECLKIGSFEMSAGAPDMKAILARQFPQEAQQLKLFFSDLDNAAQELVYLHDLKGDNQRINLLRIQNLMKLNRLTTEQLLDQYFSDPHLKGTIYALGDTPYGWAAISLAVWIRFCEGRSWLPVGGMGSVIDRMVGIVRSHGGEVYMKSPVTKILMDHGRTVGVEVAGQRYYSRFVVTNIDIRSTYQDLIGLEYVSSAFTEKLLHKWSATSSCFTIWLGMDCEIEELGWRGENLAYYRSFDRIMEMKADLALGRPLTDYTYCRVGTSGARDRTANPKGCTQVTIGLAISYHAERIWGTEAGHRGQEYRKTKYRVADQLMNVAEDVMPDLRRHIRVMEIGTPLTYERYSRNREGAYLGFSLNPQIAFDKERPTSKGKISGLYHCGNWTTNGGGTYKIIIDSLGGVDEILAEDGRDDVYDFERIYINPVWRKLLAE